MSTSSSQLDLRANFLGSETGSSLVMLLVGIFLANIVAIGTMSGGAGFKVHQFLRFHGIRCTTNLRFEGAPA